MTLVGNYTVDLVGRYDFSRGEDYRDERVQFNITIEATPVTFTGELYESEYFTVPDHSMDISEGWILPIAGGSPVYGNYGDQMSIELNLGKAHDFAFYDKLT